MTDHIEFTPTPQDLADAALVLRPNNWGRYERLRLVLAGAMVALSIFVAVAAYVWRQHGIFLLAWEDLLAFAFAGSVLGWLYGRLLTKGSEDDPRLMARSFTLAGDGFETTAPGFETKIDWTAVSEIADRGPAIFLTTEWKETFFIPKRAFTTPAEADRFIRRARDLWSARWDSFNAGPATDRPAPEKRYELSWRPERADLAAFASLKREITGWRKALIFLPPLAAGGLLAWWGDRNPEVGAFVEANMWSTIAVILILVGLVYLVMMFVSRILRAARVRRMTLPSGTIRLVADPKGLAVTTNGVPARYSWKDIPAVTLTANHLFLMTSPNRAIIVPRRAFRNRPAMVDFSRFADEASSNAEA